MKEKRQLMELLFLIETSRKNKLSPIYSHMGLTAGQPRVLNCLLEKDFITQKELSMQCMIDPTTLSRILDKLENKNYIKRIPHPTCRRSFQIILTENGRTLAQQIEQILSKTTLQMLDGITEQQLQQSISVMKKIYENLYKI